MGRQQVIFFFSSVSLLCGRIKEQYPINIIFSNP